MTLVARVSSFFMAALLIAAIVSGCNGGSGNSNTTHVPWTGTTSGLVQTTSSTTSLTGGTGGTGGSTGGSGGTTMTTTVTGGTGGTGGSTGGSGGTTMTTTVTGGTGGMTTSISTSNTGGTGGMTTVSQCSDEGIPDCYCLNLDPPQAMNCSNQITVCADVLTTGRAWMNATYGNVGTLTVTGCNNGARLYFTSLGLVNIEDFYGLTSCGTANIYFRNADGATHTHCIGSFDIDCRLLVQCYDAGSANTPSQEVEMVPL